MASNHQREPSGYDHRLRVGNRAPSPTSSRAASANNPPTPGSPGPYEESAPDYFNNSLSQAPSAQSQTSLATFPRLPSQTSLSAFPGSGYQDAAPTPPPPQRPVDYTRLPSIRLRRSSNGSFRSIARGPSPANDAQDDFDPNRPRSISQPERARVSENPPLARHSRRVPQAAMPRLTEEGARPSLADLGINGSSPPLSPTISLPDQAGRPHDDVQLSRLQRARRASRLFWPGHREHHHNQKQAMPPPTAEEEEYAQNLVDWLDVIDPEVQTLSTLTNVQNSLFIPDLGHWINRRPTYALSKHDPEQDWARGAVAEERRREAAAQEAAQEAAPPSIAEPPPMQRSNTITSRLTESHYAALPHGATLEGWTAEEKSELDDHVRHMLHSRRARFRRRLRGFGQYVRRPLGFFVTLYATLITLFGLAWVLFLIGWIYVGDEQVYAIHIIDSVLVALFAIMGDGLAPFRVVDTYHMIFIARFSSKIRRAEEGKKPRNKLRKKSVPLEILNSPEYKTEGRVITSHQARILLEAQGYDPERDGPDGPADANRDSNLESMQTVDLENAKSPNPESDMPALTYAQLKSLQHHQKKLAKSHSFYKPQETFTHNPFPLGYLIGVVILLDCHSCLQISLGATTWGIDYHTRPFAITTVILCVSIACNITAGLIITMGDRKTRKKDVWELMNRQELTEDAIKHMEQKKKKEQEQAENGGGEDQEEVMRIHEDTNTTFNS
ncbi:hypothetical protein FZEAL_9423 [Fusarium zealandicum]|uniref:Ahmp1 protein n=1 Tax=Fusarium zealandicum TaxID=1053134 RepID=A0A8H4UBT4_9HYPO|nr:hypothetical protein FZEAL_9423 [Fusarium zealandicum]